MNSASAFRWLHPLKDGNGIACWEVYDPESKVDLHATALCMDGNLYFVDPVPLAGGALETLCEAGAPTGVILTNGNHQRATTEYVEAFSIPVMAHVGAAPELTVPVDYLFGDGAMLMGELAVIALPGGAPGESTFYWEDLGGVLIVGDALINLSQTGLIPLPEKYCEDAAQLRQSLARLLPFRVETALFAHGFPLGPNAGAVLQPLLRAE